MRDFEKPIVFKTEATAIVKWDRKNPVHLRAMVTVKATDADDCGYVTNIKPDEMVDFGGLSYSAEKVCELLNCSIHKLGDVFSESVKGEVYQHIINKDT